MCPISEVVKLRKATLILSVRLFGCLSVRMEQLDSHRTDFMKFDTRVFIENMLIKFNFD
jgi:hypothetical protein